MADEQQGGWVPPSPQHQPYGYPPPQGYGAPWQPAYQYSYLDPGNSHAVAGFVMSVVSLGLLVFLFGFSAPLTLLVSIASVFVSRAGVKKVDRGETRRNRSLAQWGFWLGIVGAILSALAILAWTLIIVNDPEFFDTEPDRYGEPASLIA